MIDEFAAIHRFVKNGKGCIHVLGIDYGTDLEILLESGTKILVYRKGRREWYCIGQTKYYSPSFMVFTKGKPDAYGREIVIDPLHSPEFEFGKQPDQMKRKEAYAQAVSHFTRGWK